MTMSNIAAAISLGISGVFMAVPPDKGKRIPFQRCAQPHTAFEFIDLWGGYLLYLMISV